MMVVNTKTNMFGSVTVRSHDLPESRTEFTWAREPQLLAGAVASPLPLALPATDLVMLGPGRCTVLTGTPTMYVDLVAAVGQSPERPDALQLQLAVTGGAPITPELVKRMIAVLGIRRLCVRIRIACREITELRNLELELDTRK